jgi:arylsulfatase A-like enzyme
MPGSISNDLVMNIDIAETLLDAASVKIPAEMQGKSLLPIFKNQQATNWRNYVYYHYYESDGEHAVAKHIGIRSDRYKLINFYENKEWELFDLLKDPAEINNVYNDPAYQKTLSSMKKALRDEVVRYRDTLPSNMR